MSGIDPRIVKHEINTYHDARPIRQHLRAMNPRKAPVIDYANLLECNT